MAAGQPVVACLHRGDLPLALAAACRARRDAARGSGPELPKGGFWVLHVAAGESVALERYELLG